MTNYEINLTTADYRATQKARVVICDCCGARPAKTREYDAVKVVTVNVCGECKKAK